MSDEEEHEPSTVPQVRVRIWPRKTRETFPVSQIPRNVDPRATRAGAAGLRSRRFGLSVSQLQVRTGGQAFWRCRHGYSLVGYYRN